MAAGPADDALCTAEPAVAVTLTTAALTATALSATARPTGARRRLLLPRAAARLWRARRRVWEAGLRQGAPGDARLAGSSHPRPGPETLTYARGLLPPDTTLSRAEPAQVPHRTKSLMTKLDENWKLRPASHGTVRVLISG